MAASPPTFGSVIMLLLVFSNYLLGGVVGTEDFREWCKRTKRNNACFNIIQSNSWNNLKNSPSWFCTIHNSAAMKTIGSALVDIDVLMENSNASDALYFSLRNCSMLIIKAYLLQIVKILGFLIIRLIQNKIYTIHRYLMLVIITRKISNYYLIRLYKNEIEIFPTL